MKFVERTDIMSRDSDVWGDYLRYLIFAILSSATIALALKMFRAQKENRYGLLLGNYLTCVLIALLSMQDRRAILNGSLSTLSLGAIAGVFFVAALVFMQSSIKVNGATLTTAFTKLGLIVTLILSFAWFRERPEIFQLIGIGLVLLALIIIHFGERKSRRSKNGAGILLLILTLLGGGLGDSMAKVFEHYGKASESVLYFFWLFCTACVITAVLALISYQKTKKRILTVELLTGCLVGVPNYYSSYLLLQSLRQLPSFLVYTVFSTGTILLVMLFSVVFFKERLNQKQIIGLILIFGALVLLNL